MRKSYFLYCGLGLSILLWVLNSIALDQSLYWSLGWYDIMMHFLAGLTIGVVVVWFLNPQGWSLRSFLLVLMYVMVVSVAYEIFEYMNGLTLSTQEYPIDTTIDLVMDAIGAIFAAIVLRWTPKFSSKQMVDSEPTPREFSYPEQYPSSSKGE